MRYSTLLLGTLAIMLSHMVPGCTAGRQPTESTPLQRTADAVREAEANMTDNVIILPALEEDIVAGVRPPPYPVRARLESLVTFFCTVGSPALAQRIVWRHQNATIHGDVLPRSLKGHFYRQATSVDTSYLHIHHVKRDSGGAVECLDPLGPDGEVWRLRTYDLLVTLRAHDAFLAPMRNVSTPLRKVLHDVQRPCGLQPDGVGGALHLEVRRALRGGALSRSAHPRRQLAHPRSAAQPYRRQHVGTVSTRYFLRQHAEHEHEPGGQ
ncbi:uncharacterized protein LOC129593209 isoform X2 [Paramacrobiotus metropolitanus]|nr:uncharacterized protein LOC129593209 isoform X2 [Paramacrobiotus metropolitanus]